MAKQNGLIRLEGTMGGITFYKTKSGYFAREKGGVDANRIANDPRFQRTRENGAEFGRAGRSGKVLRSSLREVLQQVSDPRMVGRLTAQFMKVIQADQTSTRGLRNVIDGEATLLKGFEFNVNARLDTTFFGSFSSVIDRAAGSLSLLVDAFVPNDKVVKPSGSTHMKFIVAGTSVNFEGGRYETATAESAEIPLGNTPTSGFNLNCSISPASTHPLFLAVGIIFYQEVNGVFYPLRNGSHNSFSIIEVNTAV